MQNENLGLDSKEIILKSGTFQFPNVLTSHISIKNSQKLIKFDISTNWIKLTETMYTNLITKLLLKKSLYRNIKFYLKIRKLQNQICIFNFFDSQANMRF
jgi:hypothetical protein